MKKIPDPKKMKRISGPKLNKKQFENTKYRITTHLDNDVLSELRKIAKDSGSKYQTVLNQILRSALFGKNEGIFSRVESLEKELTKIKKKVGY
ncbi:MAG: BrnA antitoxin family protein [Deltaproteobacteria bacterium]|nr:BrnA antitoxin family protein [Deltaproteobacteria bacterium]